MLQNQSQMLLSTLTHLFVIAALGDAMRRHPISTTLHHLDVSGRDKPASIPQFLRCIGWLALANRGIRQHGGN